MAKADQTESQIVSIYQSYRQEAKQARFDRMQANKLNYDGYHQRQDFSYKQKGQSQEYLPKQAMAVDQAANFMQQGLVDFGPWFKTMPSPGLDIDIMKVRPSEIQALMQRQLEKAQFMTKMGDAAKLGLLGSLMIAKVHGEWVSKPKYVVEVKMKAGAYKKTLIKKEDKAWQMRVDLIRQEDYYPDPTGNGLYELQDIHMDYYKVLELATGTDAIYDMDVVRQLKGSTSGESSEKLADKSRETGQNISNPNFRKRIKLTEMWGNFVDEQGNLLYENCVCTIANDRFIIQKPTPNPYWHGLSPYVACPIITVPHSVWGKALMDAPTRLNRAINEMFNLMLDGGLSAVHGIKQIREHWLEDPSQVEEGISPGDTLRVNTSCPPGTQVLERVDTSTIPQDGMNMYNMLNQEFVTSALTNDLRMGVQPFRQVKATEVVESSQSITSMFSGLAKHIEESFIVPILQKGWKTCAQNMDDLDSDEVRALFGHIRADELSKLGPEELFAETVQGCSFEVFGISATLNKQKDFAKIQALLQTVASSPVLMEEFSKEYDFSNLLTEIMISLDINPNKLKPSPEQEAKMKAAGAAQAGQAPPQDPGQAPDMQSQIPQAGAAGQNPNEAASAAQPVQGAQFPASRATPAA